MKLREYLHSRLADPVGWFALAVIGAWGISVGFGLPPFQMLNAICVVFSAAEWWGLFWWWRSKHDMSSNIVEELKPALDRWKIAILILIGSITLGLDLWISSTTLSAVGWGLTLLGISSLITLYHAWSRPIVVTTTGLLVGVQTVKWNEVRAVRLEQTRLARIEFTNSNYFYGTKLRVAVDPEQAERLSRILPDSIKPIADTKKPARGIDPQAGLS